MNYKILSAILPTEDDMERIEKISSIEDTSQHAKDTADTVQEQMNALTSAFATMEVQSNAE